ncbi:hypothetical protein ACJ72_06651 [Emergomyces africanus]|uniref:SHSP domain-containing protein n=1 Tax=Emergomyces africanus TaxID=1955775 RepID=A0A1B7NQD4_9EURO|nr:hypothetical protein ACJ72_06651 [Emergomyces africanus]
MFSCRALKPLKSTVRPAYRITKHTTRPTSSYIHPANTSTLTASKNVSKIHNISQTRNMSFFPRFPAGDFAPLFRLLDDYESHRSGVESNSSGGMRTFAPRFDVRETKDGYHLDGELPGISQKDIDIEFTDSQTLVIKGHSERQYTASSGGNTHGGKKPRQPTVEDEQATTSTTAVTRTGGKSQEVGAHAPEGIKYWVSERSVGEFSRTFSFPTRVDQDGVKASLKDGILSVMVPKAVAPASKKISIE